jgi:N-acetylneuraminic acid mutarotase
MGTPNSNACTEILNGTVLFFGGMNSAISALPTSFEYQHTKSIPIDEVSPFAIRSTWNNFASMNTERSASASVIHNNLVYAAGGFDASGNGLSSIETYDSTSNTWTDFTSSLTNARGGLGVAVIGDKLYAFGGDDGTGTKTGVMEIHDFTSSTWSTGTSMGTARSHFGYSVEPETGRIYVFGGEGAGGTYLDSVEFYDPAADTWKTSEDAVDPLSKLPKPLKGVLCLYEGFHLKLFGGEYDNATAGATMTGRIYIYNHWADGYSIAPVELPYPARDMHGCSTTYTWDHRGKDQTDQFCFLGGGFDGTNYHDEFFRFYSR